MAVPEQFKKIVAGGAVAAGVIGVPGAFTFGADVPILISIWGYGAALIVSEAGGSTTKKEMLALATSALSGFTFFLIGSKIAAAAFNLVPGPGTLAAVGVNSSLNAFFTYRFLRHVARVYDMYDSEEITTSIIKRGLSIFSLVSVGTDFQEMKELIEEAGEAGKELFNSFFKDEL